jgi:uncharacterized protein YndB with AHSA1/START domain
MARTAEQVVVEREVAIAARPETVWDFLVDPEKQQRWMGQDVTFDLRPGGAYRMEIIPTHVASGVFVEIDPPRRLVYTWGWEPREGAEPNPVPPGSSKVEIDLVRDGEGTRLRFVHRDLPSAEAAESHSHGWDHYLERLKTVAGGGDPGADPWLSGDMS